MPVSTSQKEGLEELFVLFDRDFDGCLSGEEFKTVRLFSLPRTQRVPRSVRETPLVRSFFFKTGVGQACKAFGNEAGYPTPSELEDYMDGKGDKVDKATFMKIMEERCVAKSVCDQCDFFFVTKGNPFACLDEGGKGIQGKAFRKVFLNLADRFSEKEYDDIWTNLGISKPSDGDAVDLDAINAKLEALLKS